jgi:glycosyltransferase involved in cell wall biosynthesis
MMRNRKKRVIMAEFSDVRYDARVLKEADAISELGFDVFLLMYNTAISKNEKTSKLSVFFNVYEFQSRYNNSSVFGTLKKYLDALGILVRMNLWILFHKADVYHAHNLKFLVSSFIASIIYRAKFVYDAHEIHSEHYDNKQKLGQIKNSINNVIEKLVLWKCDAFIQASEERAVFIANKYSIHKPFVINNYVPYRSVPKNNRLREELNLKNYPIMFYSGGIYLGGGRRLDNVIKAIEGIDDIYLVIIGFMNDIVRKELESLLVNDSLKDKVYILPPSPHDLLFEYASSADFGIIPLAGNSINTKLSALNKVSEYLMSGLPILCSDYENLTSIVECNSIGRVGFTFDVYSPDSIKTAILALKQNESYKGMRYNALSLAKESFNWENEKKVIANIYSKFLKK